MALVHVRRIRIAWVLGIGISCAFAGLSSGCIGPPLDIVPEELPTAVQNARYEVQLDDDGSGSATWSIESGRLPDGLTLDESTGEITGRSTQAGEFTFRVRVDRSGLPSRSGERTFFLTVREQLRITGTPPPARVGIPYQFTPSITGGLPPYQVNVVGLPAGLTFSGTTGTITGTPLTARDSVPIEFSVTDFDDPPQSAERRTTLSIRAPAVQIVSDTLDDGVVGQAYTARLSAELGRTPYLWSIADGVLPAGLSLNRGTGVISGTPTMAGTSSIRVLVEDSDSPSSADEESFTIRIAASAVSITTTNLPTATVGAAYSATIAVTGGTAPYLFEITEGTLPAGLELSAETGEISGTPETPSVPTFRIRVSDSLMPPTQASREFSLQVDP